MEPIKEQKQTSNDNQDSFIKLTPDQNGFILNERKAIGLKFTDDGKSNGLIEVYNYNSNQSLCAFECNSSEFFTDVRTLTNDIRSGQNPPELVEFIEALNETRFYPRTGADHQIIKRFHPSLFANVLNLPSYSFRAVDDNTLELVNLTKAPLWDSATLSIKGDSIAITLKSDTQQSEVSYKTTSNPNEALELAKKMLFSHEEPLHLTPDQRGLIVDEKRFLAIRFFNHPSTRGSIELYNYLSNQPIHEYAISKKNSFLDRDYNSAKTLQDKYVPGLETLLDGLQDSTFQPKTPAERGVVKHFDPSLFADLRDIFSHSFRAIDGNTLELTNVADKPTWKKVSLSVVKDGVDIVLKGYAPKNKAAMEIGMHTTATPDEALRFAKNILFSNDPSNNIAKLQGLGLDIILIQNAELDGGVIYRCTHGIEVVNSTLINMRIKVNGPCIIRNSSLKSSFLAGDGGDLAVISSKFDNVKMESDFNSAVLSVRSGENSGLNALTYSPSFKKSLIVFPASAFKFDATLAEVADGKLWEKVASAKEEIRSGIKVPLNKLIPNSMFDLSCAETFGAATSLNDTNGTWIAREKDITKALEFFSYQLALRTRTNFLNIEKTQIPEKLKLTEPATAYSVDGRLFIITEDNKVSEVVERKSLFGLVKRLVAEPTTLTTLEQAIASTCKPYFEPAITLN